LLPVVAFKGSGKVNVTGTNSQEVRENIKNTYNYLRANEKSILNEQHSLLGYDLNIQVSNLLGAYISGGNW
jgi:ATP-dependent Lon protease